jgi:hypothetical protein
MADLQLTRSPDDRRLYAVEGVRHAIGTCSLTTIASSPRSKPGPRDVDIR